MRERRQFVVAAVAAAIKRTDQRLAVLSDTGTSTFLEVFRRAHDENVEAFTEQHHAGTNPDGDNSLSRILGRVRTLDEDIAKYAPDTLRTDLPAGFRVLVDAAVNAIQGPGVQQLVHVTHDQYQVRILDTSMSAVIIEVPAVDPTNALLAPVLAHEVAHPVTREVGPARISARQIAQTRIAKDPVSQVLTDFQRDHAETVVDGWFDELVCDAVAARVSGPSALFAVHAHASEVLWHADAKHPPAPLRIRLILRVLDSLGWMPLLRETVPAIVGWSESNATLAPHTDDDGLQYEFALIELLLPDAIHIATTIKPVPMSADMSHDRLLGITEYFEHALLPVETPPADGIEWEFVAGAWLAGLKMDAEPDPGAIARTAHDPQLNALLLKTLELARIKNGWNQLDAPQ